MFIGLHSNRNLYIGNPEDSKYSAYFNTKNGDFIANGQIYGNSLSIGGNTLSASEIGKLKTLAGMLDSNNNFTVSGSLTSNSNIYANKRWKIGNGEIGGEHSSYFTIVDTTDPNGTKFGLSTSGTFVPGGRGYHTSVTSDKFI